MAVAMVFARRRRRRRRGGPSLVLARQRKRRLHFRGRPIWWPIRAAPRNELSSTGDLGRPFSLLSLAQWLRRPQPFEKSRQRERRTDRQTMARSETIQAMQTLRCLRQSPQAPSGIVMTPLLLRLSI